MGVKLAQYSENPSWTAAMKRAYHRVQEALPIALGYLADEIPVLDNHSDKQLVDEVGLLKQAKKTIEKAEKAHVERLKARLGNQDSLTGENYKATYRGSKRVILNQGACKEVMAAFDAEEINIRKLLELVKASELLLPKEVYFEGMSLSNTDFYHTTSDGGRSLYVDPIE